MKILNILTERSDKFETFISLGNAKKRAKDAFKAYTSARRAVAEASSQMQSAYEERQKAFEEMKAELSKIREAQTAGNTAWDDYRAIVAHNDPIIKKILIKANEQHQAMKKCFELADEHREKGFSSEASAYMLEAYDHRDARDKLNDEVHMLVEENRQAKEAARAATPEVDKAAYYRAKRRFEEQKELFDLRLEALRKLKKERDECMSRMDEAQIDYVRLRTIKNHHS